MKAVPLVPAFIESLRPYEAGRTVESVRRQYDLDRIAKEANNTNYGLAASIWTRDLGTAHKLARRVRAGTVWINTHNFGDVALPFGGYKESGWGREMGKEVLELYTETKAVAAAL